MIRVRAVFKSGIRIVRELKLSVKIGLVGVFLVVFTLGAIVVTGQPGFCNSCHIMNPYYDSWEKSAHSSVNCLDCHLQPGFAGYVKGKINGLSQAVDCMVGRVGTKPNATVYDISCLRSACHSIEAVKAADINYNNTKFTHEKHIEKVVDGITISCATCHSHFEGDEHFNVNSDVCFTCHFLKSKDSGSRLVQTTCQSCHEVPSRVIERGLVTVNHAEFVSYSVSCEESCHKKEVKKESEISGSVCLNCHSFSNGHDANSMELHQIHSDCEKVECFACHGKVSHKQMEVASVSAMMDCKSCHSDTHNVQLGAYTASAHPQEKGTDRILSPMFLTHVECTGCHIEQGPIKSEGIGSIGTVAKAVPRACDRCHEAGTGQRYIPFWQGKIKKLYDQVNSKLRGLESRAKYEVDAKKAKDLEDKAGQVKSLLELVESDGSWGVHNLKYTEALLLKAKELMAEIQ